MRGRTWRNWNLLSRHQANILSEVTRRHRDYPSSQRQISWASVRTVTAAAWDTAAGLQTDNSKSIPGYLWRRPGNQTTILKTAKEKRRKSQAFTPCFPILTVPRDNQIVDEGSFSSEKHSSKFCRNNRSQTSVTPNEWMDLGINHEAKKKQRKPDITCLLMDTDNTTKKSE